MINYNVRSELYTLENCHYKDYYIYSYFCDN